MDKLKDPAMALSITNTVGIVGTTVYFYKQLEAMRSDMDKVSKTLGIALKKIGELEKNEQNKTEALHTVSNQLKNVNELINELPSFEPIEDLESDIAEIVDMLQQNKIEVTRPSLEPKYVPPPRRGKQQNRRITFEDDMEEEQDNRRRPAARNSGASNNRQPVKQPQQAVVASRSRQPAKQAAAAPRQQPRREPVNTDNSTADDDDVLNDYKQAIQNE